MQVHWKYIYNITGFDYNTYKYNEALLQSKAKVLPLQLLISILTTLRNLLPKSSNFERHLPNMKNVGYRKTNTMSLQYQQASNVMSIIAFFGTRGETRCQEVIDWMTMRIDITIQHLVWNYYVWHLIMKY